jgi:hypothetical protein
VLHETIEYIKFLHDQVGVSSSIHALHVPSTTTHTYDSPKPLIMEPGSRSHARALSISSQGIIDQETGSFDRRPCSTEHIFVSDAGAQCSLPEDRPSSASSATVPQGMHIYTRFSVLLLLHACSHFPSIAVHLLVKCLISFSTCVCVWFQSSSASPDKSSKDGEVSLKGRGLCLVPISSTFAVASEVPVDFWTPFGAQFR